MLVLSDANNINWGIFVYHNGVERALYTRIVDYEGVAPRETRLDSFNGSFRLLVGKDGTLYTYPINRKGLYT